MANDLSNSEKTSSTNILKTFSTEGIITINIDDYLMTNYSTTRTSKKANPLVQFNYFRNDDKFNNDEEESFDFDYKKTPFEIKKNNPKYRKLPLKSNISNTINRLYKPFLETKKFLINLNENSNKLRHIIRNNHTEIFSLDKKQQDLMRTTDQLFLYNNPSK